LQHQAILNAQITALQGKLRVVVAAAESHAVVMVERDASIILITAQLEKALGDETVASITLVQARASTIEIVRVFRGLAIRERLLLEALGLEAPLILSAPEGDIVI
jgi:hypothetical protein